MRRIAIALWILSLPLFVLATRPPPERISFHTVIEITKQAFIGRIISVTRETRRHGKAVHFVVAPEETFIGPAIEMARMECEHVHIRGYVAGTLPDGGPTLFGGGLWTGSGLEFTSKAGETNIFLLGSVATTNSEAILLRVEPPEKRDEILKVWKTIHEKKKEEP